MRLPGFRPGKAPAKLLEARIGREAMLDQIVNDALPSRYGQAVAESDVQPLGRPNIEVTKKEYGQDLQFTAEVDIRPKISPPDLSALTVSVDPIEIGEDDVDAELQSLRTRFGTLTAVDRPVAVGDVVSIDLSATVDGEDIRTQPLRDSPTRSAPAGSSQVSTTRLLVCPPTSPGSSPPSWQPASTPGRKLRLPSRSGRLRSANYQSPTTNSRS